MSISISSSIPTASYAAANATSTTPAPQPAPTTASSPAYVVRLTEAQQVYQLNQQGQTVSQIAGNLSLTVSAVNSYLGVTTASK